MIEHINNTTHWCVTRKSGSCQASGLDSEALTASELAWLLMLYKQKAGVLTLRHSTGCFPEQCW